MSPDRVAEPGDGTQYDVLVGWLRFHRDALQAKCAGLDDDQLTRRSVPPSAVSLLGLVRHLTEMERVYGSWALGPPEPLHNVWGEYRDGGPEWDFDVTPSMRAQSFAAWQHECAATDERLAQHGGLAAVGDGNGRTVGWNLVKLVGEYARHNGHADLVREAIDGSTGE